ncbi:MAG: hypothetical protein P8Y71_23845, partial [Pseudolabrys sp.]
WRWPSRSLLPVPRLAKREAEQARVPDTAANARTAGAAMLIAFTIFLVFESEGLRHFTRDLPGNAVTDVMVEAADSWHALMERLGPARGGGLVPRASRLS